MFQSLLDSVSPELLLFGVSGALATARARSNAQRKLREITTNTKIKTRDVSTNYDCLIVGSGNFIYDSLFLDICKMSPIICHSGPAGATAAYFMAQANPGMRVALLDKKSFPRPKPCGDAWYVHNYFSIKYAYQLILLSQVCSRTGYIRRNGCIAKNAS